MNMETIAITLDGYTVGDEMSRDEMMTCYQAQRSLDGAAVIIKVVAPLYSGDDFFRRRFKLMAEQVAALEHPHILPSSPAKETDDWLYLAQDNPQSPSLAEVFEKDGPFDSRRMQHIAAQIASALDYAHQKSITHGDLTLHQIYVGPYEQVLLANFGQSQALLGANIMKYTPLIRGPETLAPERVQGQGPSRQADLYALGVICYQLLLGKPPFTGPTSQVLHAQAHKQPVPPHVVNARIPLGVSKVIGRMLSKGVELRYNTGAEFTRALDMAKHNSKPLRRYEHLLPITEREQQQQNPIKNTLYLGTVIIILTIFGLLFAWAGYEIGLKQATAQTTALQSVAAATIVALQVTPSPVFVVSTNIAPNEAGVYDNEVVHSSGESLPPVSPTTLNSITDALLPTRRPVTASPTVSPTLSPTLTPLPPTPIASPTLALADSGNQAKFIFFNPTGYDLVIDLTGPSPTSRLIPPAQGYEFFLNPGDYQYIAHTLTGQSLQTVVGVFNLSPAQVVERDYYSDYDWTKK